MSREPRTAEVDPRVVELAGMLRLEVSRVAYHLRMSAGDAEMTPTRLTALAALERRPAGVRPGDLAAQMGITPASTSRLVEVMREAGWVSRERDPLDQRAVVLRLTSAGAQAVSDFRRRSTGRFAQDLASLDPAQRDVLEAAVPVLRALADRRLDAERSADG